MADLWTPQTYAEECPFCAITHAESLPEAVYADDGAVAVLDHRPVFPGHLLVMPRVHVPTLAELPDGMVGPFFTLVRTLSVATRLAMDADGTFVAVNNRVSQSVPHLHVHIVPRRYHDGLRGFFWPRHAYRDDAEREAVRAAVADAVATLLRRPSPPPVAPG
jgi:histidine triad (HIT) family protein